MKIGFLLGAGVSVPAGLPDVATLTDDVLRDVQEFCRHTNGHFVRRTGSIPPGPEEIQEMTEVRDLIESVGRYCQSYFDAEKERGRRVNYEDIYFALIQVSEHLEEEYGNPVVESFVDRLVKDHRLERAKLQRLVESACDYLSDRVGNLLGGARAPNEHLACMVAAMRDASLGHCHVFTLNHDLLIEQALKRAEVRFEDGFGCRDGELYRWCPEILMKMNPRVLLKLHGSLDWYRYQGLCKIDSDDPEHAKLANGQMLRHSPKPIRPLMGTFNKIRDYSHEPYLTLRFQFRRLLEASDVLFVSGYSFGDKGINGTIAQWMEDSPTSHLIVLSGNQDWCQKARGAIRQLPARYSDRVKWHPKFLSDSSWDDLRRKFLAGHNR